MDKESASKKSNANKRGLTEEEERQIATEMIPQFIAKQQELKPEYENIRRVGAELKTL